MDKINPKLNTEIGSSSYSVNFTLAVQYNTVMLFANVYLVWLRKTKLCCHHDSLLYEKLLVYFLTILAGMLLCVTG